MTKLNKAEKFFRFLIYILPGVLFFSYYPLIHFGSSESMNFEISLPIIWLVVFDILAFFMLIKRKFLNKIFKYWGWLLFPIFLSLSVLWSLNSLRGLLTVGILWLIYFAGFSFWQLKSLFSEDGFKEKFFKVFFGSTLVICVWCFVQCILDIVGVSREYSLLCAGCTYQMFGFPHPNGFAIEPQFMGNLLLAPTIVAMYIYVTKAMPISDTLKGARPSLRSSMSIALVLILTITLFLTFSRGAIYAFVVSMIFMTAMLCRQKIFWALGKMWLMIVIAFLFTLNLQGIMADASHTDDTYQTGVAKVLNHLSLGVIDVREQSDEAIKDDGEENTEESLEENETAIYDGYVSESTDTRLRLTDAAISVWSKDFKTVMFGVGLGGAGQALYVNGLSPAPKEIVQNEYASLLLETGLVGVAFLVLTIVLIVRAVFRRKNVPLSLTILVAYGITLMFFSGLPNALQIYLLPALLISLCERN
ncbi:O-antigen ligase family protein [Candidatus Saccharibacteria bacterium]|nr:O-antigen ligase family protein [Candidatus Saccharibacteria bacterium]